MRWFEERIRTCWLLLPLFAEANQASGMTEAIRYGKQVDGLWGLVSVKGYQTKWARTRNRLSPPAILNAPVVSSLQVRTAVFARLQTVGCVLWPYQYLAYRQGCKTYPTASNPFTTVGCAFQILDLWNRWQRSSLAVLANGQECDLVKFAKAYLQKEGTTTDKCASSAESDCVRSGGGTLRCGYSPDSPKMLSARLVTASGDNNRFRNLTLGYSDKNVIRERHLMRMQEEKRGAHILENIVPIRD